MCWNAEVSMQSFLIGMGAIVVAAQYGMSFPMILFYSTVVFMQLIEYIIWTWGSDPDVNFYVSLAAMGLLSLQPLASLLTLPSHRMLYIGLYILVGIGYTVYHEMIRKIPIRDEFRMYPAANGHLAWEWLNSSPKLLIYFVFLILPHLIVGKYNFPFFVLAMSTLAISVYSYFTSKTWGSMWCWMINGLVILACGQVIAKKI